eukprot:TRINITY_DN2596_c2_g2_i1.p1 TRINITY_DN2596_c2_g2~~TRINITY_DN2596_c2_g2_i1.p1  ORF type:complete len:169 (+),score=20.95 TRINITY_DN2596_c2_g2_i1:69-575(+)
MSSSRFPFSMNVNCNFHASLSGLFWLPDTVNGHLYVADTYNHRIIRFLASGTAGQQGTVVAGGKGKGKGSDQLNWPTDAKVAASSPTRKPTKTKQPWNVIVADTGNHRVLLFPSGSRDGIVLLGGKGIGPSLEQLDYPSGLHVTSDGVVYVSDGGNHRVVARRCPELA